MLTIKFPTGRKVFAIICEQSMGEDYVNGMAECANCGEKHLILCEGTDAISEEIETFANYHQCNMFYTKDELLAALGGKNDQSEG